MLAADALAKECTERARQLLEDRAFEQAEAEIRRGLQAVPDHLPLLHILVDVYDMAGLSHAALPICEHLMRLMPGNTAVLVRIAQLRLKQFDFSRAEQVLQQALTFEPQNPTVMDFLTEVWRVGGKREEARAMLLRRAELSASPAERAARRFKTIFLQPSVARDTTEMDEARAYMERVLAAGPESPLPNPFEFDLGANFYLGYQARDDRPLQEALARYYLAATPSLAEVAPHVGARPMGRKIRVGIASRYFSKHTVGYLSYGLVSLLDRAQFDVTLFRMPQTSVDGGAPRFAAAAPCVDLPDDLSAARRMIADAKLDVLHFPEIGMDAFTYFLAFARLATVQTVAWGHPITTGIPNIDLFLSPDSMEPPNGEAHYGERLVRLKGLTFAGETPSSPSEYEIPWDAGRPAYLCAQSLFKVHPDFDATLAALLRRDPKGIVYFISFQAHADSVLAERLRATLGADADRIRFLPRMTASRFLYLVGKADIVLDVPQWSGGKTSLDTFAMGTPIVHWPGAFMRGRHTLAFYRRMGIDACVVDSSDAYAETAVRLVHDAAFRADIREQIAARRHTLFNDVASIRETEDIWTSALAQRT